MEPILRFCTLTNLLCKRTFEGVKFNQAIEPFNCFKKVELGCEITGIALKDMTVCPKIIPKP